MHNLGLGPWISRRRVKSVGKPAIIAGDLVRTYDELAERIDRLADALIARAVAPGDRIAYLGANAPEFLETLFAAGAAGAVFVPLNTRLAAPEIAYQLEDSGAAIVIVSAECAPLLAGSATTSITVGDDYERMLADAKPTRRDLTVSLDDPAMILYTSGTTGRPKGAVLTHGNMTWNSINVLIDYDVTSRDVALMVAPLFHVAALGMGALPTLLKGGTLVLQSKFEPGAALAAIERHRVTTLSGVPTTFQLMVEHPDWATADLTTLEKLTCGGSTVPARVASAYEQRGLAFSGGYGMTETAPGATSLSPARALDKGDSTGLPHFFTDVSIITESGDVAAPGEVGEIRVKGPNVFREYWQRPEATAEVLVDGWLRSGDLGYTDDEGFVYVADRLKDMIISGGENIYPAEVEQILMERDEVESVAVIGVPHDRWGEVGVAVVVLTDGANVSADDLIAYFDGRIARYKVPKSIVFIDELQRTASGKPRKAELRARFTEK
ncbi:long-chain fatty acid--CoA ligase [soil metagenome]